MSSEPAEEFAGEYCLLCNQPATASWRGHRVVSVCSKCAIEILPRLQADAVTLRRDQKFQSAKRIYERIGFWFYRALTARMEREGKK